MEIERKYLVKQLPDGLHQYEMKQIEQGYLCTEPIIRIRKMNENYILTYKSRRDAGHVLSSAVINEEMELPLTKTAYAHLKEKIDYHLIQKKRYLIPFAGGYTIELDIFEGRLSGLILAEVEFPDAASSETFRPPHWLGEDVSIYREYGNYWLSRLDAFHGYPSI